MSKNDNKQSVEKVVKNDNKKINTKIDKKKVAEVVENDESNVKKVGRKKKIIVKKNIDDEISESCDTKKTQRETKRDKFKEEREQIFVRIKELIKYSDDKRFFISDDLNNDDVVKEIKEKLFKKIKLFFPSNVHARVDIDVENSHFTLVKNIFKDFGFLVILKKNYSKNDDGTRKVWYQYAVVEKIN